MIRKALVGTVAAALVAGGGVALAPAANASPISVQTTENVYLRYSPSTSAKVVELMQGGLIVQAECWESGTNVNGDSIWYFVSPAKNVTGFVAGYYLTTGHDPNPTVSHC